MPAHTPRFNISAVERETGLSKDLLRMWERRYGFPSPARDSGGERLYSNAEVAKLRAVKRLMDTGMRPGKIVHSPLNELVALADARTASRRDGLAPALETDVLDLLRRHDTASLQQMLVQWVLRQGLQKFVLETVTPLNRAVGDAWMRGELQVFEEHLYTELLQVALRAAISAFPRNAEGSPRVLLTTFPDELHGVGLLMVEALLVPEGASCVSLGTQTPVDDIHRAALAHRANIVALSFSGSHSLRFAVEGLDALRAHLPAHVTIWAGGEMSRRIRRTIPGTVLIPDLASVIPALRSWRAHRAPG
ncbi:HTH-type transcriptional repressor CarH [Burkholderiales bacterium]|nr:HTH-type transcriptional repressor CarH [Burkholderiales bacterium]